MDRPRWFLVFILLCLFPFVLAARETSDITVDKFEEISGKGLSIRSSPAGAKVFIDNIERGLTPLSFDNLPPGEYSIKLTRDGYKDRLFNVVVLSSSRMEVSIKMEEERGFVRVTVYRESDSGETLPFNPQIISSRQGQGELWWEEARAASENSTSADFTALLNLPAGYRTIRARAFGWEDASAEVLVSEHVTATAEIYMKPAAFKLEKLSQSRKRFNPKDSNNLGLSEYRFEVSAPGTGTITITDKNGAEVFKKPLEQFNSRLQSVTWDGKNSSGEIASEGIYTVTIEASALAASASEETSIIKIETEVNFKISIFPLSLSGGLPGLVFAPLPHTLSARSFQIEGGILFGSFRALTSEESLASEGSLGERPFSALPFEIGLRVAPIKKLEVTTSFNANPRFASASRNSGNSNGSGNSNDNKTGWGITGTVKYNFLDGSNGVPIYFAAGASYAYASKNGEAPLSPGRGVGLYAPLALEIKDFTIAFSPAAFWRGPVNPAPALLLSAGVMYRGAWFSAGLSARPEIDFTAADKEIFRLYTGVEARFYPPPSFLLISFQTGIRTQGGRIDGYGGLGIGVIY